LYTNPDPVTHQYKFGEENTLKTFILEIKWTENYPSELPQFSLDLFYNNNLLKSVKEEIIKALTDESDQYLGMSMTYSLFEWVRENVETLLTNQAETVQTVCDDLETKLTVDDDNNDEPSSVKTKVKKEQLSKAQKRAQWKKGGLNEDDRERGWNWVDIVRHLSQTANSD